MVLGLELASEMSSVNFQDPDTKISCLSHVLRHSGCLLGHLDVPNPVFTNCDTDLGWPELMFGMFRLNIHEKAILDKYLPICPKLE